MSPEQVMQMLMEMEKMKASTGTDVAAPSTAAAVQAAIAPLSNVGQQMAAMLKPVNVQSLNNEMLQSAASLGGMQGTDTNQTLQDRLLEEMKARAWSNQIPTFGPAAPEGAKAATTPPKLSVQMTLNPLPTTITTFVTLNGIQLGRALYQIMQEMHAEDLTQEAQASGWYGQ
jgi:hypothetical protein